MKLPRIIQSSKYQTAVIGTAVALLFLYTGHIDGELAAKLILGIWGLAAGSTAVEDASLKFHPPPPYPEEESSE